MLARAERNWSSRTPLVGMQSGAATVENSLAAPQRIKQLPYDPAISFLDMHQRN